MRSSFPVGYGTPEHLRIVEAAQSLCEMILTEAGARHAKTIRRNVKTSGVKMTAQGPQVTLGYESVARCLYDRFYEYKTVGYVWRSSGGEVGGIKGVWQLVLHEAAHVYDHALSGTFHHHRAEYQKTLAALIAKWPFEKVSYLFALKGQVTPVLMPVQVQAQAKAWDLVKPKANKPAKKVSWWDEEEPVDPHRSDAGSFLRPSKRR